MTFLFTALSILFTPVQASAGMAETTTDNLYPVSTIFNKQKFVYQLITQEYITNENDFFLDVKLDTCFLIFSRTEGVNTFDMGYYGDAMGGKPWKKANSIQQQPLQVKFNSRGAVEELVNWPIFRDALLSGISKQAIANLISSEKFDEERMRLNSEKIIRRLVMEDINYLFDLCDDTIREDGEYIRVKPVRSPFSGEDMYLQGNLTTERPAGTKNTVKIFTKNAAGVYEKPILLEECNEYAKAAAANGSEPLSEIQRVGLNNEVEYQYNSAKKIISRAIFSDVLAINFQSRGNIRTYTLWDAK
ncbi:MAG: hypothetical protein O2814_01350 [Bacteroidetes bacterium]|nr:hypothetical protein [Bacteroidota bacterium]MDA1225178.1 hypothetical protein [Bacteroidota bacterium]